MKIAVLGAGHGGQAMTADLTLGGHEVRLAAVKEHATNIHMLNTIGGIIAEGVTATGAPPGFAKPAMITTDVAAAITGAEVIMVVVPGFAQEIYMKAIIEQGQKGQLVVFNPGKFGTLLFAKKLREARRESDFLIGETSCLIYAAKTKGLGHVNIKAVKSEQHFAALPSYRTAEALWKLTDLYPQFSPANHVFQTSLDDAGMVIHPVSTLMNASRIEQMGPYRNAHYDITPSIARVIEAVDAERIQISQAFRYETYSLYNILKINYNCKSATLYEGLYEITAHNVQMAPADLKTRYVSEDVPYSLVPAASIGRLLNIKTPGIEAFITVASMANGVDYWQIGRNIHQLGLTDLSIQGLLDYVTGQKRGPA